MSIARRKMVEIDDIHLDRYYPPTQENLNQLALDYDQLRGLKDKELRADLFFEISRVTLRAAGMSTTLQDENAYMSFHENSLSMAQSSNPDRFKSR